MRPGLLRHCVRAGLVLTAAVFLTGCPRRQKMNLDRVYFDARATLHQAAEDPDPQVRTKALEALAETEGSDAGALMMQALQDERAPVRFAAAMAAGDIRYLPAKPLLLAMAKDPQTPPKLLCAAAYALHRMGDYTYTGELGRLLRHRDRWVRATVAMVLGRLGEPSAEGPLDSLRRDDHDEVVQLQVVEALAALGNARAIALLRAFTKSRYLEDQIIAVQGLGKTDVPESVFFLRKLLKDRRENPAVRVAAAASLARLGRPAGYELALQAATEPQELLGAGGGDAASIRSAEVTNLQTLGALALGQIGNSDAIEELHPLVRSGDGAVRVAACKAILQLLKDYRPALPRPAPPRPTPPAPIPPQPPAQPAREPTTEPVKEPATKPAIMYWPDGRTQVVAPPGTRPPEPTTQPVIGPRLEPTTRPSTQPTIIYWPDGRVEILVPPASQPSGATTQPTGRGVIVPPRQPSTQPTTQRVIIYWPDGRTEVVPPTSQPATQPASRPTTQPATQPTTRPVMVWPGGRTEVLERLPGAGD